MHGLPQKPIRFGLITAPIRFKPRDYIGIQPHGHRLLCRPVELADLGATPVKHQGSIGKINFLVAFYADGADVSLLLLREFLHKPSFRGTQPRVPR